MGKPAAETDGSAQAVFLTIEQYCKRRGITRRTAYKERLIGSGPPFFKPLGSSQVLYPRADVEAWEKSRTFPHLAAAAMNNKAA